MLTLANDDVAGLLRLVREVVLEDRLGAGGVARLGVESGAGVMGNHAVSATERVVHRAPWVVSLQKVEWAHAEKGSIQCLQVQVARSRRLPSSH